MHQSLLEKWLITGHVAREIEILFKVLSKEDVPTWCKQFYYDFIS